MRYLFLIAMMSFGTSLAVANDMPTDQPKKDKDEEVRFDCHFRSAHKKGGWCKARGEVCVRTERNGQVTILDKDECRDNQSVTDRRDRDDNRLRIECSNGFRDNGLAPDTDFELDMRMRFGLAWENAFTYPAFKTLIAVLEQWDWPTRKGLAAVRAEVLGYFRNQAHRMDYPTYDANGWSIGSGAVESACKTVVGQRLKGAGMRWSEAGGDAVCHVRALYRSELGQWAAFWRPLAA